MKFEATPTNQPPYLHANIWTRHGRSDWQPFCMPQGAMRSIGIQDCLSVYLGLLKASTTLALSPTICPSNLGLDAVTQRSLADWRGVGMP